MPVRPPVPCPSRVLPSSRRSLRPQAPDETPEVTREDQQRINAFGRLNNQLHELQAELEGKKARRRRATTRASAARRSPLALAPRPPRGWAHPLPRRAQKLMENLEEAENELLVSDDQETGYVLGECFVRLPNEEAETRLQKESKVAEKEAERLGAEVGRVKGEMEALKKARRRVALLSLALTRLRQLLYSKFGSAINLESD